MTSASDADTRVPGKLPEVGHVLWCYFEYKVDVGPAARHALRHPVLVLATAEDAHGMDHLIVAGGTSAVAKDGAQRPVRTSDFLLRRSDPDYKKHGVDDQLVNDTKFSLLEKDILKLPYTTKWFYTPPGQQSPRIGKVKFESELTINRLKIVMDATGAKETIRRLVDAEDDKPSVSEDASGTDG